MLRTTVAVIVVSFLAACASAPQDRNDGELVASEGVRALFDEPGLDAETAGKRVRCERHRRVGTHMVTRVCMTIDEWDAVARNTRYQLERNRERERACIGCISN